jgi:hypothetical protein
VIAVTLFVLAALGLAILVACMTADLTRSKSGDPVLLFAGLSGWIIFLVSFAVGINEVMSA